MISLDVVLAEATNVLYSMSGLRHLAKILMGTLGDAGAAESVVIMESFKLRLAKLDVLEMREMGSGLEYEDLRETSEFIVPCCSASSRLAKKLLLLKVWEPEVVDEDPDEEDSDEEVELLREAVSETEALRLRRDLLVESAAVAWQCFNILKMSCRLSILNSSST